MENYKRIRKLSRKWAYFLFMDHREYIADSLFIQEKCEVSFLQEYEKQGTDWLMVYVRVRRTDVPKFQAAMTKLKDAALLKGYTDYDQAFETYWAPFMKGAENEEI